MLYDSDNHPTSTNVIHDAPQIYNNSANTGFGGGQGEPSGDLFADDGPFNASLELNEEQYLLVFSSFRADALGSMSVDVHGPNELSWAIIPEPATIGLFLGGVGTLFLIRKRILG